MKRNSRSLLRGALLVAFCFRAVRAEADPVGLQWPQPAGPGTDVTITYSYSNLLDGGFRLLKPAELKGATEEAMWLWARFAPLHFVERPDTGPPPSDLPYPASGHPLVRIGAHPMSDIAHGFYPGSDGLAGDIHFDPDIPWRLEPAAWNFLEAVAHELGHALGLGHEMERDAIMNPFFPQARFTTLGSAFLLPPDIAAIQSVYGAGQGSVQPLSAVPEPATLLLVGSGLTVLARFLRRQSSPEETQ